MKKIFAMVMAAVSVVAAEASAQVMFSTPIKLAGTGCKPGSFSVTGAGTDTIIKFKAYDAAKPIDKSVSKMQRAMCSFTVPVKVSQGFQVSVMTATWQGYAEGNVSLFREYFFAGQRGPRKTTHPEGDYREIDNLTHAVWSGCGGGNIPIRINSSAQAVGNISYIKVEGSVQFHLKWRKCR